MEPDTAYNSSPISKNQSRKINLEKSQVDRNIGPSRVATSPGETEIPIFSRSGISRSMTVNIYELGLP
jgi:hypothetical protein